MCRCGTHDSSQVSQCLELFILQLLVKYKGTQIPRDLPPWEKLLSFAPDTDNVVASALMMVSSQLEPHDRSTLVAALFTIYRLIRVRLAEMERDSKTKKGQTRLTKILVASKSNLRVLRRHSSSSTSNGKSEASCPSRRHLCRALASAERLHRHKPNY